MSQDFFDSEESQQITPRFTLVLKILKAQVLSSEAKADEVTQGNPVSQDHVTLSAKRIDDGWMVGTRQPHGPNSAVY